MVRLDRRVTPRLAAQHITAAGATGLPASQFKGAVVVLHRWLRRAFSKAKHHEAMVQFSETLAADTNTPSWVPDHS